MHGATARPTRISAARPGPPLQLRVGRRHTLLHVGADLLRRYAEPSGRRRLEGGGGQYRGTRHEQDPSPCFRPEGLQNRCRGHDLPAGGPVRRHLLQSRSRSPEYRVLARTGRVRPVRGLQGTDRRPHPIQSLRRQCHVGHPGTGRTLSPLYPRPVRGVSTRDLVRLQRVELLHEAPVLLRPHGRDHTERRPLD